MRVIHSIAAAAFITVVVFLFSLTVVVPGLPKVAGRPDVVEEVALNFEGVEKLRFEQARGNAVFSIHDDTTLRIEGRLRVFALDRTAPAVLADYVEDWLVSEQDVGLLTVEVLQKRSLPGTDLRVDWHIHAPRGMDIDYRADTGNVRVAPGAGNLELATGRGDLVIAGVGGALTARTDNGSIRVEEVPGTSHVDLHTVNGPIEALAVSGPLRAATSNGSIMVDRPGHRPAACDLTSVNGDITVLLDENCAVSLNARTANGSVRCALPVEGAGGQTYAMVLAGALGSGGEALTAETRNGDIRIGIRRP